MPQILLFSRTIAAKRRSLSLNVSETLSVMRSLPRRSNRHAEIYELEMRIREALTFIFLDEYWDEPYTFLNYTSISTTPKDNPSVEHLQTHCENQLFHVLFNDYANLNNPNQTKLEHLLSNIRSSPSFEELKQAIEVL